MQTDYQTYIEFCDYAGNIDHTLRHWSRLSDNDVDLLKDEHKKRMSDYEVRIFNLENREYILNKIIKSIPDKGGIQL